MLSYLILREKCSDACCNVLITPQQGLKSECWPRVFFLLTRGEVYFDRKEELHPFSNLVIVWCSAGLRPSFKFPCTVLTMSFKRGCASFSVWQIYWAEWIDEAEKSVLAERDRKSEACCPQRRHSAPLHRACPPRI